VRGIAKQLRKDGLRVWFDEWILKAGDSIPAKIEEGLEHSRVLVLCMSANAFGSDWAQLESGTFRFRDPLNKQRRFIPLRLDDAPIKGSLAQFLYIKWPPANREEEYAKLLEACQPVEPPAAEVETPIIPIRTAEKATKLNYNKDRVQFYTFSADGKKALVSSNNSVKLWKLEERRCLRTFKGASQAWSAVWSKDQVRMISASSAMLQLWDMENGRCLSKFEGHAGTVFDAALSADGLYAISGSSDSTL